MSDDTKKPLTFGRRGLLKGLGAAAAAAALPTLWLPRTASAADVRARHRAAPHLHPPLRRLPLHHRLQWRRGDEFNPFGRSAARAPGTEWGVSSLLERASWLEGDQNGTARADLGMQPVTAFTNEICVLPCVDHEPFSARADGNHGTGLERFLTGYVGGSTSFLTYLNYGLREKVAQAAAQGKTLLPAFSLGEAGMALGAGIYAGYRPPVLDGSGFERFAFDPDSSLPAWAAKIAGNLDTRFRDEAPPGRALGRGGLPGHAPMVPGVVIIADTEVVTPEPMSEEPADIRADENQIGDAALDRPRPPRAPNKPAIIERFAAAHGFQKDGDGRFFDMDGSWIVKTHGESFPWQAPHRVGRDCPLLLA